MKGDKKTTTTTTTKNSDDDDASVDSLGSGSKHLSLRDGLLLDAMHLESDDDHDDDENADGQFLLLDGVSVVVVGEGGEEEEEEGGEEEEKWTTPGEDPRCLLSKYGGVGPADYKEDAQNALKDLIGPNMDGGLVWKAQLMVDSETDEEKDKTFLM